MIICHVHTQHLCCAFVTQSRQPRLCDDEASRFWLMRSMPASSSVLLEFSQDLTPLSTPPTFCKLLCTTPSAMLVFNTVEFSMSAGSRESVSAFPAAVPVPFKEEALTGVVSAVVALLSRLEAAVTAPATAEEFAVLLIALVALLSRSDAADAAPVTADVFAVLLTASVTLLSRPEAAEEAAEEAAVTAPAAEEAASERKSRVALTAELFI